MATSPARAIPSLDWDYVTTQGRNVRLLATAPSGAIKWCLAVDQSPITDDVLVNRYQDTGYQLYGATFASTTGCWTAGGALRYSAEFNVPLSSVPAGHRTFALTVTWPDLSTSTISSTVTIVHQAPTLQWDWQVTNSGAAPSVATGVISYGMSTTDPVTKWCLAIDSSIMPFDLAESRNNDFELSDSTYDKSSGCWTSANEASIFTGRFVIPTYTLKNGTHEIRMRGTDRYGESSELMATFTSRNRTTVNDLSVSAFSRPYPSKKAHVDVHAVAGSGATSYRIFVGGRKVKSGRIGGYGAVSTSIGDFPTKSSLSIRVEVSGINGTAKSRTKTIKLPPPLAKPVPPALPSRRSSTLGPIVPISNSQRTIRAYDCVMRPSAMSSDWHGQGYDWTIYYIYNDNTKSAGRTGFGYLDSPQGYPIPADCHT